MFPAAAPPGPTRAPAAAPPVRTPPAGPTAPPRTAAPRPNANAGVVETTTAKPAAIVYSANLMGVLRCDVWCVGWGSLLDACDLDRRQRRQRDAVRRTVGRLPGER